MPEPSQQQQAIIAAYGRLTRGQPVRTGDTSFWRQFGLPSHYWRLKALSAADALRQGSEDAASGNFTGPLSSIYAGTGFDPATGDGGPAGTGMATVKWKAEFVANVIDPDTGQNKVIVKSGVTTLNWGDDLELLQADIDAWAETMEGLYEGSAGGFVPGSTNILWDTLMIY
jgi:hypothetical protein